MQTLIGLAIIGLAIIGLAIVETDKDYSWLPRKLREELKVLKFWRMLRGSYRYSGICVGMVEGRGGKPVTAGDHYYARRLLVGATTCCVLISAEPSL